MEKHVAKAEGLLVEITPKACEDLEDSQRRMDEALQYIESLAPASSSDNDDDDDTE